MPSPAPDQDPPAPLRGSAAVEAIARLWVGRFTTARQVEATLARGGPAAPELTRDTGRWRWCGWRPPNWGMWCSISRSAAHNGRLPVQSERLRGWAMDVPQAPGTTVLLMESRDGSGLQVQEISQLLAGGRRRFRPSQILQEGRLVSRSHIDEHKASDDGQAWTPPGMESDD